MSYLFYILLGLLPSLVWLSFYLRKDKHPEPNSAVLKTFFWGMSLAPLAVILELFLIWLLSPSSNPLDILSQPYQASIIKVILAATLIPALVEEYLKYSVVRFKIMKSSEFDEPTDAMIYCLIIGLGFAAVENMLILFKISFGEFGQAFLTIGLRFLGATLVHALASAIVGYWLTKSILSAEKKKRLTSFGLTLAILFHTCYNYLIITVAGRITSGQKIFLTSLTALLLVSTALTVSYYFKKLKKQQSVCEID